ETEAEADAKAKKQKAAEEAKRKAEADAKAKQQKAAEDAKRKAEAEAEEKAASAKKAQEEAAQKKGEAKKIASSAKRDFEQKIRNAWDIPAGTSGQKATARVTLSDSGTVLSVVVSSSNPDVKASVEAAIRSAAPYPMPSDPDARREARSFSSTFTAK
ncbi:TonB C-terminal domain-containing protein, partial [Acinetobacter nosocomialis]|uniref:TonB C-terminal domain-containing protein n=1 Tax=Acinetobacter nosocomialis TaxID=106654 RepID=UPI0024575564